MNRQAEISDADSETIRILLVEDNPGDARLLREMLAQLTGVPLSLEWVDRLAGGLERVAAGGIDVMLLDLSLPDAAGLDTLVRMQAQAPHVPIIVLTGLEDEALALKAVREGAQDYLVKGQVNANLLLRAARYAIERKRIHERMRELSLAMEQSIDGIAIGDLEPTIRYVNDAFARMHGYSPEEMIGMRVVNLHNEDQMHEYERGMNQIKTQGSWSGEIAHIRKDGTSFPTYMSVTLLMSNDGRPTGILAVCRDISERKKAEEEKRELQEQLAHAQKMEAVGTLAGGIAHEFNNINAAIIGYIDFTLQTEELSATARRNLEVVRSSVFRGANLTRSLLAFSEKHVSERKPLSLQDVVDSVLRVTEKEFTSEGIELTVRHSMKASQVSGDASLLSQVVMNLVVNARHAMLESPVKKLSVQTGTVGGRPFIRVKDTGCGIPKEAIPKVFEPFFTTKGSLASGGVYDGKAHGTGLGLSLCHSIIAGHDGEIKVSSQVGKGTTFTVYFPPASESEPLRQQAEKAGKEAAGRIMVVDDEKAITELLLDILSHAGYAVHGFTNPKEAIKALGREEYSLAFIDLQMPEMAGEDFMERVNHLPPERRPLKVILTGRLESSEEDVTRLNVFASLHKPFSNQQLLDIVEEGFAAREKPSAKTQDETRERLSSPH